MSTALDHENLTERYQVGVYAQRRSKTVKFVSEVAKRELGKAATSVEIFCVNGRWYCQVRRGDEKTRPMGPYTKHQAEQIQDARRMLIARIGSARLIFERAG